MKNLLQRITQWFSNDNDSELPNDSKKEGFIQFFNRSRGYGFIQSKETSKKVFVHVSELQDRVKKGDKVQFELDYNEKGLIAREVKLARA